MFCRLRQCRQILPKLILLPYLLFFFYGHNVSFFRLPCPPLAKRGSLTHSQALALSKRARDVTALLGAVFLKSSRPSLPLKKAPPLISVFSPQGRRGKPPSGAQNRYALRLADHQRSSPCCAGWDRLPIISLKVLGTTPILKQH